MSFLLKRIPLLEHVAVPFQSLTLMQLSADILPNVVMVHAKPINSEVHLMKQVLLLANFLRQLSQLIRVQVNFLAFAKALVLLSVKVRSQLVYLSLLSFFSVVLLCQ